MIKGFLISIFLLLTLGGIFYLTGFDNFFALGALIFLIPAFPLFGILLGHAGTVIQTKRFTKLFFLSIALVYFASFLLSTALVLTDQSEMIKGFEIPRSIFMLATIGFFIYGTVMLPFLILGVFILERWTRNKALQQTQNTDS